MELNTWTFDTAHSGVNFSIRHMVFAKVRGRFGSWKGTLRGDPTDLSTAAVEVEIDAASIDTGVADRDTHLRSADFLDVEHFPTLVFKSKRVERLEGSRYRLHGDLTLRQVTRPVALDVEYGGQAKDPWGNERIAFTASVSLDRRDFGLQWNQVLEAGGVLVGERVDVEIELQAVKAAAAHAA